MRRGPESNGANSIRAGRCGADDGNRTGVPSLGSILAVRMREREPPVEALVSNPESGRYLRISVFGVRLRVE